MRGGKECPFSGVTKSGRVWRKVPDSDARSVRESLCVSFENHDVSVEKDSVTAEKADVSVEKDGVSVEKDVAVEKDDVVVENDGTFWDEDAFGAGVGLERTFLPSCQYQAIIICLR